jgi:hypothetical protein
MRAAGVALICFARPDLPESLSPSYPYDTLVYFDQCGWDGFDFDGVRRRRFRFADSHITGSYKDAGAADTAEVVLADFSTAEFAGVVCVSGEATVCTEQVCDRVCLARTGGGARQCAAWGGGALVRVIPCAGVHVGACTECAGCVRVCACPASSPTATSVPAGRCGCRTALPRAPCG